MGKSVLLPDPIHIIEFIDQQDLTKFDLYSDLKFSDGNYMGAWFKAFRKQIIEDKSDEFSDIRMQYLEYLEFISEEPVSEIKKSPRQKLMRNLGRVNMLIMF